MKLEEKIEEEHGRKLTRRQQTFARLIVEGLYSIAECARRAGYSHDVAAKQASVLLNGRDYPHVLEYIQELREQRERGLHLLEQMQIVEHAHKLPSAVSGGQQQRVAVARAMANNPPILVADEPTGSLDSVTAASVLHVFESLVAGGTTVLLVTHDRDIAKRATRVIKLADGEIVGVSDA